MLLRETNRESCRTGTSWCEPLESRLLCAAVTEVRGDFTGDGRVDIVTTRGGLKLRVGTAKGFEAGVPINGVGFARGGSVAAADFNGDGSLDLAVFGGKSTPATLRGANGRRLPNGGLFELLNNGNGTFRAPIQVGNLTSARVPGGQVVTGDFDLNGNEDILVTNGSPNTTPTPFNNVGTTAGGTFAGTTATGTGTTGVTGFLGTSAFGGTAAGTGLATGTSDLLGGMSGSSLSGPVGATASFGSVFGTGAVQPAGTLGPPATPATIFLFDGNGNGTFQSARRIR